MCKKIKMICSEKDFRKTEKFVYYIKNYLNYSDLYLSHTFLSQEEVLKNFDYEGLRYIEIDVDSLGSVDEIVKEITQENRFLLHLNPFTNKRHLNILYYLSFDTIPHESFESLTREKNKLDVWVNFSLEEIDSVTFEEIKNEVQSDNYDFGFQKIKDLLSYDFYYKTKEEFYKIIFELKKIGCSFICLDPFNNNDIISTLKVKELTLT